MATEIWLTDGVVRVTAVGAVQALFQAIDVSKYDQADLTLWIAGLEGPAVTTFVVSIITGMSTESEDGWTTVASFSNLTAANTGDRKNFPQLQKYVRWKVTGFTGPTAVTFSIRGMLRSN